MKSPSKQIHNKYDTVTQCGIDDLWGDIKGFMLHVCLCCPVTLTIKANMARYVKPQIFQSGKYHKYCHLGFASFLIHTLRCHRTTIMPTLEVMRLQTQWCNGK